MLVDNYLINKFRENVKVNLSSSTADSYWWTLRKYCLNKGIRQMNDFRFFGELKGRLKEAGFSLSTISRHVFAVKKFLLFLNERYGIEIIDLTKIKCQKPKPTNPITLSLEEINQIRKIPIETRFDLRDRVLFEFLLDTWCRVSEALDLTWEKIDLENNEVEILGKGSKKRVVFICNSREWLLKLKGEGYVFWANTGRKWTRLYAERAIKKMAEEAKIPKKITPHTLRRTGITFAVRNGIDLKTIQTLAGHEDLETTLRYVALEPDLMRQDHKRLAAVMLEPVR